MVSLKKKQSGFTIVELLIVIVIIGILAALVITTFVGIQQRARNSERQTDINAVSSQLEGYFAKHSGYPDRDDLNDALWREGNPSATPSVKGNEIKLGDSNKAAADPSSTLNPKEQFVDAVPSASSGGYAYVPTATDSSTTCQSPTDENAESNPGSDPICTKYTLTAVLEGNNAGVYEKKSAN